jgi:hypothetical protein
MNVRVLGPAIGEPKRLPWRDRGRPGRGGEGASAPGRQQGAKLFNSVLDLALIGYRMTAAMRSILVFRIISTSRNVGRHVDYNLPRLITRCSFGSIAAFHPSLTP